MVELRKCEEKYYMIEANPRLWGPSQLFCDAGYNLFEFFLKEYQFIDYIGESSINYQEKYFWSGGVKGSVLDENSCVWLGDGKLKVKEEYQEFRKNDIYKRQDTINIFLKGENRNE